MWELDRLSVRSSTDSSYWQQATRAGPLSLETRENLCLAESELGRLTPYGEDDELNLLEAF